MSSTTFYYSNGTTSTSTNTTLTTSSYSIPGGFALTGVDIGTLVNIIGTSCFQNRTSLTSVVFLSTSSCNTIQVDAFRGCSGLTTITFPASLKTIQRTAFYQSGLTTLNIPSTLTTIGDNAFDTTQITSVTLPNTVTSLGQGAIANCPNLTTVVISAGRTSIPWYLCNFCSKLTSVSFPNTLTSIDYASFENCTSLRTITFPPNLQVIGDRAFQYCASLNIAAIPSTVTTIGGYGFSGCHSITNLTIPSSLTTYALGFQDCDGLTTLTFSSGCTLVDSYAFRFCNALSTINFANTITTIRLNAFQGCTALTTLNLPTGLTTMGTDIFSECTGLVSVVVPNGVTTLTGFRECSNLTTINIPNSVTSIGDNAFFSCTSLQGPIVFPPNLTYIGSLSFYDTGSLWTGVVTIPSTVTEIGYDAFSSCLGITGVNLPEGLINLSGFSYCPLITSVTIPSTVQRIEYRAFSNTGISSITFPSGLLFIGQEAFNQCTGFTSVVIPPSVIEIENYAFGWMSNLTSVTLNEGLQILSGFFRCTALTSVAVPSTVTTLGGFYGCSALSSINIPYGVTTLSTEAFAFCTSLVNVIIPDTVTTMGPGCYDRCTSLRSIKLSNNLSYLGYTSFRQTKLSTITIPASLTVLGYYQFSWCVDFTSVIFVNTSNLTYQDLSAPFTENPPLPVQVRFLAATSYNSLNAPSKLLVNLLTNFNGVQMTNISILYGAPCFLEGTKILAMIDCEERWVPIETLRPTDLVKTIYNSYIPIDVIGYKDIENIETDDRVENRLYVYRKGKQHPELFDDLVLTGTHSVLVKEITEEEREKIATVLGQVYVTDKHYRLPACVDKRSEPYPVGGTHRIYHFALENADYYMNYGVYANGMLVESSSKRYINEIANMNLFYAE